MSRADASLELLLRIRQQGEEQLERVNRAVRDLRGETQAQGQAQREMTEQVTRSDAALRAITARMIRLAAAFASVATARRAMQLSDVQERAELRVLGLLQSQLESRQDAVREQERLLRLAGQLQQRTRLFGDEEFLQAAGTLIGSASDLDDALDRMGERLLVVANTAVALFEGRLQPAAEALGRTLGGDAGRLARLIPELRDVQREMTDAQFRRFLREGGAFEIAQRRFGGLVDEFADTPIGRQQAAMNRFGDIMEEVGALLKIAVVPTLEQLVPLLERIAPGEDPGAIRRAREDVVRVLGDFISFVGVDIQEVFRGLEPEDAQLMRDMIIRGLPADDDSQAALALLRRQRRRIEAIRQEEEERRARVAEARASGLALTGQERNELLQSIGLLGELDERLLGVLSTFEEFESFRFTGDFRELIPADQLQADVDALFNLAQIRERATVATLDLARAQERFDRAAGAARDDVQAGFISRAEGLRRVREAAEELETAAQRAAEAERLLITESEIAIERMGEIFAAFEDEPLEILPPRVIEELTRRREDIERELELLNRNVAGLSAEFGQRVRSPLADFFEDLAAGEARLADFGLAFARTMQRILAEQAALRLLQGLLGGEGDRVGGGGLFGGLFDGLGGILGFSEGGMVPGPDLGRDSTIIAARGGEFVVRPEAVRQPGALPALEELNARLNPDAVRLVGGLSARPHSPLPGYATGGFVEAVGRLAPRGEARERTISAAVAALPADERTMEALLHGGRHAMREFLLRNPDVVRAAGAASDDGGFGL